MRSALLEFPRFSSRHHTRGKSSPSCTTPSIRRKRTILLAGLGVHQHDFNAVEAYEEWKRRQAIPFDLEAGVTIDVYYNIRQSGVRFLDHVEERTNGFTDFDAEFIQKNPYLLPILQHLSGVFSKQGKLI